MLKVERDCDLGDVWVEGLFRVNDIAARLALQRGIPEVTVRARIIEAAGYCKRPPKGGKKVMYLNGRFDVVDEQAVRAMRRVIFDFVSSEEVEAIVRAYLAEENGEVFRASVIHLDNEIHPYVVTAVLATLKEEGRLPAHPSQP